MSEELVIQHCAPTLAGIKTANLFSCPYESREEVLDTLRRLNRLLVPKGVRAILLKMKNHLALIYLYRPSHLSRDFSNAEVRKLLERFGYEPDQMNRCLNLLCRKLNYMEEFPHEIGLFLGYPPEDVSGFIENQGRNFKCVGAWKVYGDEQSAQKRFSTFKKCTTLYCRQWNQGKSIVQLTVPCRSPKMG